MNWDTEEESAEDHPESCEDEECYHGVAGADEETRAEEAGEEQ